MAKESYTNYTDEQLIRKMRSGEGEIMDYLMDKYKPLVLKRCKALYLIGGETEDLIQEGMIGLFKAVKDFQDDKDASFFTFADLCISRQLYHAIEASNRKKHGPLNSYVSLDDDNEQEITIDYTEDVTRSNPEQFVLNREFWEDFKRRIQKDLSPLEQKVMNLYLEGLDYQAMAKVLDKSPKSIDNALQRIKKKIRKGGPNG
ncbi:sigma-70 family RNA polymerase sigma factor [Eubacterium oxidoreducens]|uniref:RNA polymerase, sigma 30 subunit, SigH n=1 Tax=Eubacterium oxidoreducens TaxID=1732 RepID=A0A1G6BCJ8_EUBOX|nr:sigma-70 family RNA polymerase sigma factor [Eubacterium oxidoreducens]SDB18392.1 RNA polymerase, sigma 30 subunit, SigH [Eubacterium oxidoreducens]